VFPLIQCDHRRPIFGTTRIHFSIYEFPTEMAIQTFYTGAQLNNIVKIRRGIFIYILMVKGRIRAHQISHQFLHEFHSFDVI